MGKITHNAAVYMWPTHALFTYRKIPQYSAVWYPWEFGDGTLIQNENVITNYDKQYMTMAPLRVPHNSFLTPGTDAGYDTQQGEMTSAGGYNTGLPNITWVQDANTGVNYYPTWGGQTDRCLGINAYAPDYASGDTNSFALHSDIGDHHGAIVSLWIKPQPDALLASGSQGGTSSRTLPTDLYVGVQFDTGTQWRIISKTNWDYQIQLWNGSDWLNIITIPRTTTPDSGPGYNGGNQEPVMTVEFRLVAGRFGIRVNDMAHEFTFLPDYNGSTGAANSIYITTLFAGADGIQNATLYGEPIKWNNEGSSTSTIQSSQFSSMTISDVRPQDSEGSSLAFTHTLDTSSTDPYTGNPYTSTDGPDLRYKIDIAGPTDGTYLGNAYSDLTAVIRGYELNYDGEDFSDPAAVTQILPEKITVSHVFDPGALTIHSTAKLEFNNFDGSWGNFMLTTGQVAIQIYAQVFDDGTLISSNLIFTGYGHRRGVVESSQGGSTFTMMCSDRLCQLQSPRWDLPRMDAWNQFYAAGYLMQQGGISPDDFAFNYLVPSDPFGDLGDQFGNPAPFLGIGDSGSLVNRYANGELFDLLIKQANPIGYMMFADVGGGMHFEKFQLTSGIKTVFFDSDLEADEAGYGPNGLMQSIITKDQTQIRSDSIVIGINSFSPYWNPIIERRPTDPGTNPIVYSEFAYNHLGYSNPSVWVDGIFANEAFASNTADFMNTVYSLPGLNAALPTMWLQPDVFPLDTVVYDGDRIPGLSGIPLMVTEVEHVITVGRATSTISAKYVPGSPPV